MAITTSGTTLTFNDSTTQTTAPVNTNANVNSVSAGTGISVSSTTGAVTVTNSGVTSITNGGGLSISGSTGSITITNSNTGTVTSVATGNGLQGGTITSSGTLSVACPSANSVGSYAGGCMYNVSGVSFNFGSNYSAGGGNNNVGLENSYGQYLNSLSGTWKWMAGSGSNPRPCCPNVVGGLLCRVA